MKILKSLSKSNVHVIEIVLNGWKWKCFTNSECESFEESIIIMSWIWMALVSVWKLLVFKHFFFEVTCMYCKKLRFSLLPPPSSQQNNLKVICKVLLFYLRNKKILQNWMKKPCICGRAYADMGCCMWGLFVFSYKKVKTWMQNIWIRSMYLKKRQLHLKAEFIWHWKNICHLQEMWSNLKKGNIITKEYS